LFDDGSAQTPSPGVTPYDVIAPLFSDYAEKLRFVYTPKGKPAQYKEHGVFEFPVGSVLIKTFAYADPAAKAAHGLRLIETRLLIHQAGGWVAYPYVWDDAQSDATLKKAGKKINVTFEGPDGAQITTRYAVPNINQCKGCHVVNGAIQPIGPKARNLNNDYQFASGRANQLSTWRELDQLTGFDIDPSALASVVDWRDPAFGELDARARAYLDANCAHCHSVGGPAHTSGLFLEWEETKLSRLGVNKKPIAAGRGSGDRLVSIKPGAPDKSILLYRMESLDPGVMMPELGRTLRHAEGIALIREWIAEMD
jgi:uncharacterized repeat protein (TIGR03806 family)